MGNENDNMAGAGKRTIGAERPKRRGRTPIGISPTRLPPERLAELRSLAKNTSRTAVAIHAHFAEQGLVMNLGSVRRYVGRIRAKLGKPGHPGRPPTAGAGKNQKVESATGRTKSQNLAEAAQAHALTLTLAYGVDGARRIVAAMGRILGGGQP